MQGGRGRATLNLHSLSLPAQVNPHPRPSTGR